ncbi:hypothetical protein B0H13DRAFT_2336105 [Mycena leptocephala]|nr:hypothetical protein B0H13DRAFT_2336105 [Mycena leptocephala]
MSLHVVPHKFSPFLFSLQHAESDSEKQRRSRSVRADLGRLVYEAVVGMTAYMVFCYVCK